MRGIPHALIGTSCGLIVASPAILDHPGVVGLAIVGSLLPDIDHQGSLMGRNLRPVSWLVTCFVEHRGPFHSLVFAAVFGLLAGVGLDPLSGMALALGYVSHLAADSLTLGGLPLLWPVPYLFRLRLFRSGSFVEWPIALVVLIASIYVVNPGLFVRI